MKGEQKFGLEGPGKPKKVDNAHDLENKIAGSEEDFGDEGEWLDLNNVEYDGVTLDDAVYGRVKKSEEGLTPESINKERQEKAQIKKILEELNKKKDGEKVKFGIWEKEYEIEKKQNGYNIKIHIDDIEEHIYFDFKKVLKDEKELEEFLREEIISDF